MGRAQVNSSFFTAEANAGEARARTKLPCFSRVCAALVILAASLVLIGWASSIQALIRLLPSAVAMKPMTALVVLAAGISLWRLAPEPKTRAFDGWAQLLALFVLVISAVKLFHDFTGLGFQVDNLLFPQKLSHTARYGPSEMAPNTALGLFFCGLGLLLMDCRKRKRICPGQIAILVLAVISLLALTGYAYQVLFFYRVSEAQPMSLECAIGFGLLCAGFLAARPEQGLMKVVTSRTAGGTLTRRLLPVAILMPLALGALLLWGERAGYYEWEVAVSTFAVASVVIFSLLIGWNARLLYLADRVRARTERRVAAHHQATRALAESSRAEEGLARLLRVLGEGLGWSVALLWTPGLEREHFRCSAAFLSTSDGNVKELITSDAALISGQDLPGQVWKAHSPVWLPDAAAAMRFPRAAQAAKIGLRSGGAFLIWVHQEPYGVLEFFSHTDEIGDPVLQEMLSAVGTQAGLFLERMRAEEQLRQTSANLQRSNTELQQFAYIASHDLFEPLRMVTSYLQLLSLRYQARLDAQANEFIGLAVDGAKRMHALINDLLEYSRLDSRGRSFEATELDQVLEAAISNLKVAIEESAATINRSRLPEIQGDRVQLTQLFQNLIGNAIKFRRDVPPLIDITAEHHKGEWYLGVSDNGIGIEPKFFDRIFVLFQRLHTRQEYAGTGMGLAICKKIVERHGGRIWVESRPGEGSTFWFTLPDAK